MAVCRTVQKTMRFRAVFRKNKTRWYTEEVANNTARPIPMGARRFAHEWLFALHRAGDPRLVISSYAWWLAPYEEYLMEIPWLLGPPDDFEGTRLAELWGFVFRAREYPGLGPDGRVQLYCPPASRYLPMVAQVTEDRSYAWKLMRDQSPHACGLGHSGTALSSGSNRHETSCPGAAISSRPTASGTSGSSRWSGSARRPCRKPRRTIGCPPNGNIVCKINEKTHILQD